jgi:pimeloyl-ACP methyl ester carboxylesterase
MIPTGWLDRADARLAVHDAGGAGAPVIFQHGLLGDASQTAEAFPADPAFRRVTLDCPGHGASPAVPDPSIARFADDVAALAATLPPLAAIGGISMGAAIALRLAVTRPGLAPALILVRPAWGTGAAPPNMAPNALVGDLLARLPAAGARAAFAASDTARDLAARAPDNLASLTGVFGRQPQAGTARLLTAISADGPGITRAELARLGLPVLVCATDEDLIHPLPLARDLAAAIPGARLVELPPKGRDRAAHISALHAAILSFLREITDAPTR